MKVLLPGMLGMFAGPIQAVLQKKGDLLLEDHRKWSSLPRSGGEVAVAAARLTEGCRPSPP